MPEKLQLYGLYVYYVVHICDFGMLRVKGSVAHLQVLQISINPLKTSPVYTRAGVYEKCVL